MQDNFLIKNSLTCLNDQPTFFRRGMKSCIDHVYTNTPQYTSNITTHNFNILSGINSLSDHSVLSFSYKQDNTLIQPIYKITRDFTKLTKNNLELAYDNNYIISEAFHHSDPNIIADIFVNEMEIIQNSLAPPKRVQIRNNLAP